MTSDSQITSVLFRAMQHRADAIAEGVDPATHRFRAELLAGPRYAYPPTLVAPGRVEAEFVRSSEPRPVVVAIELREGALTIQCACGRSCSHAMMVVVDLACCPVLRASLDGEIDESVHRAVTAARLAFVNRGRARREVLSWLDATRAEPYEPVRLDLSFSVRNYAQTRWGSTTRSASMFSMELVVSRPQNNHRLVSADELIEVRLDPRVRALLDQLDPSPSGRKSFHLDGRCGGAVLEELVALGATLDRRRLSLASEPATVQVHFDESSGQGDANTTRITARFVVGERALGEQVRWFDGLGPMLLDVQTATLYRIDRATPRPLIERAADHRALSLPFGADRGEAYRSLRAVTRASAVVLPPPESLGLPSKETPSFALILDGTTLHLYATLVARYPSGSALVSGESAADADTWRDVDAEQQMLRALCAPALLGPAPWAMPDESAARFWFELLPRLEGMGVRA